MYTLDDIKHLLDGSIATALSKDDRFASVLLDSLTYINDQTGLELTASSDTENLPWLRLPLAFIIQKLTLGLISVPNDEFLKKINSNFEIAMKILNEHKAKKHIRKDKLWFGHFEDLYRSSSYPECSRHNFPEV